MDKIKLTTKERFHDLESGKVREPGEEFAARPERARKLVNLGYAEEHGREEAQEESLLFSSSK